MSKIIGIDLGTTNSCVAVIEGQQQKVIEKQPMLKSGITGQVSILLGKRTVIEYFLDPIFIALRQVMKEA